MSRLLERLKNIHISRETYRETIQGKRRKIAVVNQTFGNDLFVRAFPKTGPVEVEIQEVYIQDHAPIFVEGAQTVTRIIEPGKPINIGKHFAVGVVSVKKYDVSKVFSGPQLLHQAAGSQTK